MDEVAGGQRMVILALAVNVAALVLRGVVGDNLGFVATAAAIATVFAVMGLLRLATGLGYPRETKVFLVLLSFVPVINLLMLAMVNDKATKALRAAGYKVGFLGATGKNVTT